VSLWTRFSRGFALWAAQSTRRTVLSVAGVVLLCGTAWWVGPGSLHQFSVRCPAGTQIRTPLWDGTVSTSGCDKQSAVSVWRPFRRTATVATSASCRAPVGEWIALTPLSQPGDFDCPLTVRGSEAGGALFEVFAHDRQLDLSGWAFVAQDRAHEPISRAVWTDRIKLRRQDDRVDSFCIRHASSGLPTPEFSSTTHDLAVKETTERPVGGPQPRLRIFDVCVRVSREPVDNWFDTQITAVYWNAFNSPEQSWAGMPLPHQTRNATFAIRFPSQKRPTIWERREGSRDTDTSELVTDDAIRVTDGGRELKWGIQHPRRNWVYKVVWKW